MEEKKQKQIGYQGQESCIVQGGVEAYNGQNYYSLQPTKVDQKKQLECVPFSCIGLINITGQFLQSGTGFLISEQHVLTAAHVICSKSHNNQIVNINNIGFYPHIENKNMIKNEKLKIGVKQIFVNKQYQDYNEPLCNNYDYALLLLDQPIGKYCGYLGLIAPNNQYLQSYDIYNNKDQIQKNSPTYLNNPINICGYPSSDPDFVGMCYSSHYIYKYTANQIEYCMPTWRGQSGGPIYCKDPQYNWVAFAIHIYGDIRFKFANRITVDKYNQILQWKQFTKKDPIWIDNFDTQKKYFLDNIADLKQKKVVDEVIQAKKQELHEKYQDQSYKVDQIIEELKIQHKFGIHSVAIMSHDIIATGEFEGSKPEEDIPKIKIWNLNKNQLDYTIEVQGSCRKILTDGYLLIYIDDFNIYFQDWFATFKNQQSKQNEQKFIFKHKFDSKLYGLCQLGAKLFYIGDSKGDIHQIIVPLQEENERLLKSQIQNNDQLQISKITSEGNKHEGNVFALNYFLIGQLNYLLSGGKDGNIIIWRHDQNVKKQQLSEKQIFQIETIFNPNNYMIAISGTDNKVQIFNLQNLENDQQTIEITRIREFTFQNNIFSISALNDKEIAVSDKNKLVIIDIYDEKKRYENSNAHKQMYKFKISKNINNSFYTAGDDNAINQWSIDDDK